VSGAKRGQRQVEAGYLISYSIEKFQTHGGTIGQGIATILRLADDRPEINGIAGAVDRAIAV